MATIKGTNYSEVLFGTDGQDSIYGYDGNDIIVAGDGSDYVEGGDGADTMDGGDGNDTLSYKYHGGVKVDLASGTGTGGDTFTGFENLVGSNWSDQLWGDNGGNWLLGWDDDDFLYGRNGSDHLLGLDGDDALEGGSGADQLDGGAGIDWASYASSSAGVQVSLVTGKGHYGEAAGDTLYDIENLEGSDHADMLLGDKYANVLDGEAGDDLLKGGGGADTIAGGAGIDTADYTDSTVGVYVTTGGGSATGFGFNGVASGDKLYDVENLNGSSYDDVLGGDFVTDNALKGLDGNDILRGYGGADTLDGGKGIDTAIYGGSGSGVVVTLAPSSSSVGHGYYGSAEGDTLISIENLTGSDHADLLWGNNDANVLDGMSGKDELKGAGGADTLIGGMGADTMAGGLGADIFLWQAIAETGTDSSTMDSILDFKPAQGDKIDVHAIDANGAIAGNAAFTFVGTASYSGPGQIRYYNDGVDTYIGLNRDNVANDDATIRIAGVHTPDASWFVL